MQLYVRLFVYVIVSYLCIVQEKTLLNNIEIDGFTNQILYVRGLSDIGVPLWSLDPLLIVHYFRFLVATPLDYIDHSNYSFLTPIIVLILLERLSSLFKTNRGKYIFLLVLILPLFMSYRNILVISGVGYLMYYFKSHDNMIFLILSALLVNLSSGSVLVAVVCSLVLGLAYRGITPKLLIYIATLTVSLVISLTDKYAGFTLGESGYAATEYGATGIFAIITRSTIYVSIITGDYFRAAVYFLVGIAAIISIIFASRSPDYRGYVVIFVASLPVFLVEGLGVVALIIPILLFLSADKLPFRPRVSTANRNHQTIAATAVQR